MKTALRCICLLHNNRGFQCKLSRLSNQEEQNKRSLFSLEFLSAIVKMAFAECACIPKKILFSWIQRFMGCATVAHTAIQNSFFPSSSFLPQYFQIFIFLTVVICSLYDYQNERRQLVDLLGCTANTPRCSSN